MSEEHFRQGGAAEDAPCKRCRWWDPRVLNDSLGLIYGVCYCSREEEEDYSCFEAVEGTEEEKEP